MFRCQFNLIAYFARYKLGLLFDSSWSCIRGFELIFMFFLVTSLCRKATVQSIALYFYLFLSISSVIHSLKCFIESKQNRLSICFEGCAIVFIAVWCRCHSMGKQFKYEHCAIIATNANVRFLNIGKHHRRNGIYFTGRWADRDLSVKSTSSQHQSPSKPH